MTASENTADATPVASAPTLNDPTHTKEHAMTADATNPTTDETKTKTPAKPKPATTSEPKTTPTKYQQASKTEAGDDLTKLLIDGLKAAGVKATKAVAPAGHYYRVVVDGKPVAYVNHRGKGAIRVEPKLDGGRTPKGFEPQAKVRGGLGYVALITDKAGVANAVAAVKLAAEKAAAEKAAKPAPAKTPASAPAAAKADDAQASS